MDPARTWLLQRQSVQYVRDISWRYITGQIAAGEYAGQRAVHPAYSVVAESRRSAVHAASPPVSSRPTSSLRHAVRERASRRANVQPRSAVGLRGRVALWRSTEYQTLC